MEHISRPVILVSVVRIEPVTGYRAAFPDLFLTVWPTWIILSPYLPGLCRRRETHVVKVPNMLN